jgi:hypothetical protein
MASPLPYDYLVQRALEGLLQEQRLPFPHAIVSAHKDFAGDHVRYVVRVNANAKAALAKCLEDLFHRRFWTHVDRWILERPEAEVLAALAGYEPDSRGRIH